MECARKEGWSKSHPPIQVPTVSKEGLSWSHSLIEFNRYMMGNKPPKPEKEEVMLKIVPPLDQSYVRWLARDLERIHGFTPRKVRAIKPPDHYIEYMRLNGWLDLDLDDPDLARLLKQP